MSRLTIPFLLSIAAIAIAACGAPITTPPPSTVPVQQVQSPTAAPASTGAKPAAQGLATGRTLVINDPGANVSLDPFASPSHTSAQQALYATLVALDLERRPVGYLAEGWDLAADGTSVTFTLVPNATFHDGSPVDAEAVAWNLRRWIDPTLKLPRGQDLASAIDAVEVVDQRTLRLRLKRLYPELFESLSRADLVSPTAYERLGADFATAPVGAGPFRFESLVSGSSLTLVRNPDFAWAPAYYSARGPARIERLEIKMLGEEQTVLNALRTGEITQAEVPLSSLPELEADPGLTLHTAISTRVYYLFFNTAQAPWDDTRLRGAIASAIDRDELLAAALDGRGEPTFSPIPLPVFGYDPTLVERARGYDPDGARAALDALGYLDADGDGYREDPQGQPWVVPLLVPATPLTSRMAEVLSAQLQDVGVRLEIEQLQTAGLIDLANKGEYEIGLYSHQNFDLTFLNFFFYGKREGFNRSRVNNPALNDLIDALNSDLDPTTRTETARKIQDLIAAEQYWIPLVSPLNVQAVRGELRGWAFDRMGQFRYLDAYFAQ